MIRRHLEGHDAEAATVVEGVDAPSAPVLPGDAPPGYGPSKTLYNRFVRWSRLGVFGRIFGALAAQPGVPEQLMIDSTHLKAHRTAASLLEKGLFRDVLVALAAA